MLCKRLCLLHICCCWRGLRLKQWGWIWRKASQCFSLPKHPNLLDPSSTVASCWVSSNSSRIDVCLRQYPRVWSRKCRGIDDIGVAQGLLKMTSIVVCGLSGLWNVGLSQNLWLSTGAQSSLDSPVDGLVLLLWGSTCEALRKHHAVIALSFVVGHSCSI